MRTSAQDFLQTDIVAPCWAILYDRRTGRQDRILRCFDARELERVVFHNRYYGCRVLVVRVKTWR